MCPQPSSSGCFRHLEREIIKLHTHTQTKPAIKLCHWLDLEFCEVGQSVLHSHENLLEKS